VFKYPGYKRDANQTTLTFHLTPVRMAIIKGNNNNKCWQGCGKTGTLLQCWECKWLQPLWKAVWRFLKKQEIDLPYDPVTPLLGIYPKVCKTGYSRDTCTPTFIAALLTIAKLWKQPRHPTIDDGSRKCGIYTQWSVTQSHNDILFEGKWMGYNWSTSC
jgi:hypothetical protein